MNANPNTSKAASNDFFSIVNRIQASLFLPLAPHNCLELNQRRKHVWLFEVLEDAFEVRTRSKYAYTCDHSSVHSSSLLV